MELASMLAGEPLTDQPRTVGRTVAALLRGYNDGLDDERRQGLKRYAAASLGTARGRAVERARGRLVRAWLAAEAGAHGWWAALGLRIALLDPAYIGHRLGTRVRAGDDDALHARVLGLIDALIALGASSDPFLTAPETDRVAV
jgi:hypothetical protein